LVSQLQGLQVIQIENGFLNNELFGDISFVKTLSNLQKLHLAGIELRGSLDGNFQTLNKLSDLSLKCPMVVGDISSLSHLKKMKFMSLNSMTKLTGDINVLSKFSSSLQVLQLAGCENLQGNISSLSNLTNLTSLSVTGSMGIHGDTETLGDVYHHIAEAAAANDEDTPVIFRFHRTSVENDDFA
jgi:hypothetical protein